MLGMISVQATTRQAKSKVKKGAAKTSKAVNTNARLARNKVTKAVLLRQAKRQMLLHAKRKAK